jgi:hypothetical protein
LVGEFVRDVSFKEALITRSPSSLEDLYKWLDDTYAADEKLTQCSNTCAGRIKTKHVKNAAKMAHEALSRPQHVQDGALKTGVAEIHALFSSKCDHDGVFEWLLLWNHVALSLFVCQQYVPPGAGGVESDSCAILQQSLSTNSKMWKDVFGEVPETAIFTKNRLLTRLLEYEGLQLSLTAKGKEVYKEGGIGRLRRRTLDRTSLVIYSCQAINLVRHLNGEKLIKRCYYNQVLFEAAKRQGVPHDRERDSSRGAKRQKK